MNLPIPNQFPSLYNCKIELTGEKLCFTKPDTFNPMLPFRMNEIQHVQREVAIKFPEDEYHRFMANWNQYMDVLSTAAVNPMVKEQYHQLLMLVSLLK